MLYAYIEKCKQFSRDNLSREIDLTQAGIV